MPGRKTIIQIEEMPILQQSHNITQYKTRPKMSTPEKESSLLLGRPEDQDKVIPVPDYTIPKTMSELDLTSRTITRKGMQDIRREIPAYANPFYRPLSNQLIILDR